MRRGFKKCRVARHFKLGTRIEFGKCVEKMPRDAFFVSSRATSRPPNSVKAIYMGDGGCAGCSPGRKFSVGCLKFDNEPGIENGIHDIELLKIFFSFSNWLSLDICGSIVDS